MEVRQPLHHPASVAGDHAQPPHAPQITLDRLPNPYQQPIEQSQIDDGPRFAKIALEGIQQRAKDIRPRLDQNYEELFRYPRLRYNYGGKEAHELEAMEQGHPWVWNISTPSQVRHYRESRLLI